jgi:dihydroceramidase
MINAALVSFWILLNHSQRSVANPELSRSIMEVNIRPSFRAKYATIQQKAIVPGSISKSQVLANEKRDKEIIRVMWIMVAWGLGIFLGGFAIWGLDRIYCGKIRRWRREVGLPWGILLEGHGWW